MPPRFGTGETMWVSLGDLRYELLTAPTAASRKLGATYSEHARVEGKPRLQWTGDELETVDLEFHLFRHARIGDPDAQIQALADAMAKHEALPLVYGDGRYPGRFVITAVTVTTKETAPDGATVEATVKVSLKEWVGESGAGSDAPSAPLRRR